MVEERKEETALDESSIVENRREGHGGVTGSTLRSVGFSRPNLAGSAAGHHRQFAAASCQQRACDGESHWSTTDAYATRRLQQQLP